MTARFISFQQAKRCAAPSRIQSHVRCKACIREAGCVSVCVRELGVLCTEPAGQGAVTLPLGEWLAWARLHAESLVCCVASVCAQRHKSLCHSSTVLLSRLDLLACISLCRAVRARPIFVVLRYGGMSSFVRRVGTSGSCSC